MAQIFCFIGYPSIFSTDTILHAGAALVRCGKRVLLVDMKDSRGLRSQAISDWVPPVQAGIYDALFGAPPEIVHRDGDPRFPVLPDSSGDTDDDVALNISLILQGLERRLPNPRLLRDVLAPVGKDYEFILIDGGDLYFLPAMMETMYMEAGAGFIVTIYAGQKGIAKDFRKFLESRALHSRKGRLRAIVFSEHDENAAAQRQCIDDCREIVTDEIPFFFIDKAAEIDEAFRHHKDIFAYAPQSKSAAQYAMLAKMLLGTENTANNGFLSRYEQLWKEYSTPKGFLHKWNKKFAALFDKTAKK